MIIQLDAYGYSWIKLWIRGIQQDTVDLLQNAVGYEGCGEIQIQAIQAGYRYHT